MTEMEKGERPPEAELEVKEEEAPRPEEIEEGRTVAVLSYIPGLCFIPLFRKNRNRFALEHARQGLILFIVEVLALLFLIPVVSRSFWIVVLILCLISALVGIVFALQGKFWRIPFIGELAERLKIPE